MVDSLTLKEYFWTSGVESSEPVLVVILLLSKRMDRHPTSLFHHYEVSWIRDQCVCVDGCCVAECFAGISIRSSATGIRTSGISVIQSSFVHSWDIHSRSKEVCIFCNFSSVVGRVLFVSLLLCSQVDLAIQARENDPRGSSAIGRSLAFQWKLDSSNVSWQKWIYHNSCIRLVSSMCLVCYFSTKTAPIMDRFNTSLGVMYGDQCK